MTLHISLCCSDQEPQKYLHRAIKAVLSDRNSPEFSHKVTRHYCHMSEQEMKSKIIDPATDLSQPDDRGYTLLECSAERNYITVLTELLNKGLPLGRALERATYWGSRKAMDLLIKRGGYELMSETQMHSTVANILECITRYCLDHMENHFGKKTQPEPSSFDERQLYQVALNNKYISVLRLLLEKGHSKYRDKEYYWEKACELMSESQMYDAVNDLLKNFNSYNYSRYDDRSRKYIHYHTAYFCEHNTFEHALDRNYFSVLTLFFEHGFTLNSDEGHRCLMRATRNNQHKAIQFLIEHGVDINTNDTIVLQEACQCRGLCYHPELIEDYLTTVAILLKNNANVNARIPGRQNWTPLHCAVMRDSPVFAKLLLQHGADITIENDYGQTPLDLVCSSTPRKTGTFLKQWQQYHAILLANNTQRSLYKAIVLKALRHHLLDDNPQPIKDILCVDVITARKRAFDCFDPEILKTKLLPELGLTHLLPEVTESSPDN